MVIPHFRCCSIYDKTVLIHDVDDCRPCCISLSVLCTVDLTSRQVSLQIEKVGSDPYCEMSLGSKVEKKINVAAGTKASLSFLDCPNEEVRLTASEVIGTILIIFIYKARR